MSSRPSEKPPLTCENRTSETGQRANADPFLVPLNLAIEGSGPVHIVPGHDSTEQHPPDVYASRMSRADGCPSCVLNYALPNVVLGNHNGGFRAHYTCESCGHDWITEWSD